MTLSTAVNCWAASVRSVAATVGPRLKTAEGANLSCRLSKNHSSGGIGPASSPCDLVEVVSLENLSRVAKMFVAIAGGQVYHRAGCRANITQGEF